MGALFAVMFGAPSATAGDTACWIDHGALVASAAFGDIAGDFLIDLAASKSALHVTPANLAGLTEPVVRRELRIAGRRSADFPMAVVDLDARTTGYDTTINGILGADMLGGDVLEVSFSPCRLRLSPGHGRAWPGAKRLPLVTAGGRPTVEATLSDGKKIRVRSFGIGTAAWPTRLIGDGLARPVPTDPTAVPAPIRLRALELGGRLFEQVPVTVGVGDRRKVGEEIGLSIWSRWRLRLDPRGGWLEIAPPKTK